MNPPYSKMALICPYTLIEEEALAWSTLLFDQSLLLHPFPLTLPNSHQTFLDQGRLQVRVPNRSQEEIRMKDKSLRGIQALISSNPDQGFLKYLNQVNLQEDQETQEELVGLLKGQPPQRASQAPVAFDGQILLCLIHDWMTQQWALEEALSKIEEQEKGLALGWQEELEEGAVFSDQASRVLKRNETEIPCPLALKAWKELKNQLVSEPCCLFTNQPWVWKIRYGTDWEECQVISIALPEPSASFSGPLPILGDDPTFKEKIARVHQTWESLLTALSQGEAEGSFPDFQKALSALDHPEPGRYRLILPNFPPSRDQSQALYGLDQTSPLVLMTA